MYVIHVCIKSILSLPQMWVLFFKFFSKLKVNLLPLVKTVGTFPSRGPTSPGWGLISQPLTEIFRPSPLLSSQSKGDLLSPTWPFSTFTEIAPK